VLVLGAICGLGLLGVPMAGAQSAQATCELRDVTQAEGTQVAFGEPDPGEPLGPSTGGTDFDFVLACQVPAEVQFDLNVAAEDGTAVRSEDYGIPNIHVVTGPFATPQDVETPITVGVLADPYVETDETFTVRLTTTDPDVVLAKDTAVGTIVNDDDGAPCLLLSQTQVTASAPFSTAARREFAGPLERVSLLNCGGTDSALLARGTNATGSSAAWELTNASSGGPIDSVCELGPDLYRADLMLWSPNGGSNEGAVLTTQDQHVTGPSGDVVLAPVSTREFSVQPEMPCEGSSGLGQPMSLDVVVTAIAP
jgi:hypothetical protein